MPTESTCDDCSHCKLKTGGGGTCYRYPPSFFPAPNPHDPRILDDTVSIRPWVSLKEPSCGEFNRAVVDQSL